MGGKRNPVTGSILRGKKPQMIIDQKTKEIYCNIWFGHFYRPAYDDEQFLEETVQLLRSLGFNSVLMDMKDWEDLALRAQGGEASQYVKAAEILQQALIRAGMSYEFLALYLNGDNLYPHIRFSPPIYGESVIDENGRDGKWYRYWSEAARDRQAEHVRELMQLYGDDCTRVTISSCDKVAPAARKPICSMWDPIAAPSFDEEGRGRYLGWLEQEYRGSIRRLNEAYHADYESFGELQKEDYWFGCRYPDKSCFTREDLEARNERVKLLSDNMKWRRRELREYFAAMKKRLSETDPELYTVPDLTQWGYFLNIDGSMLTGVGMADLWDTAVRGIDLYELAELVDCAHFISVPVTSYGDPDAYVVSCEHAMMRAMNRGRDWIGGIYWGRFLYNDLYAVLTPEEIVGSMVAAGISGYTSYGVCGMDDGGLLHRMDPPFLEALRHANRWMQRTLPQLGARKTSEIGILFPTAMAACESMQVEGNKERRLDLLGWYRMCCDLGYSAEVIDRGGVLRGLEQLKVLIVPADDCYYLERDCEAEKRIFDWVRGGGILVHGPEPEELAEFFGISRKRTDRAPIAGMSKDDDRILVQGPVYAEFGGEKLATFLSESKTDSESASVQGHGGAVTRTEYGKGSIYSFGFLYGYSYIAKIAPHVPRKQRNNELYPLSLSRQTWLFDILQGAGLCPQPNAGRGIETALFEGGEIVVNHTSYPFRLENGEVLGARQARFLPAEG